METLANIMLFACIAILAMQFVYDARYEIRARIKAELRTRTRAKKLRMLQQRNIA